MIRVLPILRSLLVALAGALLCVWLRTPLPWLLGPLVGVAVVSMLHGRLASPPGGRETGQWIIGAALGLYFSPDVVREIVRLAPWVALAVAFALALGLLGSWLLRRLTAADPATAFFGMAIGGASEMAVLAERNGGLVARVAAAHSLRIMLVVLIVPLLLNAFDVHGADPYVPSARTFSWPGFALLAAVTGAAAVALGRIGSANGWMIGPLVAAAVVTAAGGTWSALPASLVNAGQLLIGIGLGTRFTPEFFESAPRFLGAVAAITLVYLVVAAAFGALLAFGAGMHWATALVATTPGGIGEMALTAQALELGVPVVTAFHAIRMAAVVLTVGVSYRGWIRWKKARADAA
jgi:membrane AbrB-like protein